MSGDAIVSFTICQVCFPPRDIGLFVQRAAALERKLSRFDFGFVTGANVSRTGNPGFFGFIRIAAS